MNFWQSLQPPATAVDLVLLSIQWYGIIVTLAIVVALGLARRWYRQAYGDDKVFFDAAFWAIVWGLIGARFFHVFIFQWAYYSQHPAEIIRIWEGGIAIQGGLLF